MFRKTGHQCSAPLGVWARTGRAFAFVPADHRAARRKFEAFVLYPSTRSSGENTQELFARHIRPRATDRQHEKGSRRETYSSCTFRMLTT